MKKIILFITLFLSFGIAALSYATNKKERDIHRDINIVYGGADVTVKTAITPPILVA